ncbi:MAG: spermidine synthase, partial [Sulfolobales archaeon]
MLSSMFAIEPVSRTVSLTAGLKNVLVNTKTKYQSVQIVELEEFGKALILDGLIQSSQADEFVYHESLVHPALLTHPNPKKVLIIGGGEGAALREVLKHPTVTNAVMVDIDGELVELSKRYLEEMHNGSFNDPRSKV